MTPERFQRIEEVFHGALELAGADRAGYLQGVCDGDEDLRHRVHALLAQHEPTSGFLEPPDAGAAWGAERRVGRYRVVRLIAAGGMGTVYEAEQERPLRRVALKVMRGGLASESSRRRFEFESQVLASLRHPGIAQVYEAGVYEDLGGPVPFFAMELVHGPPITEYCRTVEAGVEERLRLVQRACEAVQHAHQRGVIHRDIKPSNILVETPEADGAPAPKVIDFGIARVVAGETPVHTLGTEAGGVIGTLAYMSPEQCAGSPRNVDTRSDVYSLGVVLYQLLCGRMPYEVADKPLAETASIICSRAPTRPSSVDPRIRGDLETILLKALEKEPERRYQSAGELAKDLERFLCVQPIEARPPTALYQVRLFARRHRALVAAGVGVALLLVAATAVSVTFALVAHRQTRRAELEESRAQRRADFLQGAIASANPWFPPAFPDEDLSDYEPWDEWQHSPWAYAGMPGRSVSVVDIALAAGDRVETEFADDPAARARLSDTLGWTLQRLLFSERHPAEQRMLKRAELLLRDALATRRDMLGDDHEDTIRSMMRLGEFLDYTPGGAAEGGALYDEAWRTCVRRYGPHDARTLHALRAWVNNQSFMHARWEQGKARLEDAVGWAMDPGAEPSVPVLITLSYYAFLCGTIQDFDHAVALAKRSVDGLTALAGEGNIRTAFAQQYAGQAMISCGRYAEAEQYLRASVAGHEAFFGPKSLETAYRVQTLATTLAAQKRWHEAAQVNRRAYEVFLGVRGVVHYDTLVAQWNLAECLWFAGEELAESERFALGAYEGMVKLTAEHDGRALYYAYRLAEAGYVNQAYERTLEFLEQQIAYADRPGVDAMWGAAFRRQRALCLTAQGQMDDAKATLAEAISVAGGRGAGDGVLKPLLQLRDQLDRGEKPRIPSRPAAVRSAEPPAPTVRR